MPGSPNVTSKPAKSTPKLPVDLKSGFGGFGRKFRVDLKKWERWIWLKCPVDLKKWTWWIWPKFEKVDLVDLNESRDNTIPRNILLVQNVS